jgi:hypothetical protein
VVSAVKNDLSMEVAGFRLWWTCAKTFQIEHQDKVLEM